MSEGGEGVSAVSRVEVTTSGDRVFSAGSRGRFIKKSFYVGLIKTKILHFAFSALLMLANLNLII